MTIVVASSAAPLSISDLNFDDILFDPGTRRCIRDFQRSLNTDQDEVLLESLVEAVASVLHRPPLGLDARDNEELRTVVIKPLIEKLQRHRLDLRAIVPFLRQQYHQSYQWTQRGRFPSWTLIAASVHVLECSDTGHDAADAADRVLALLLRLSRLDFATRYYLNAYDCGPNLETLRGRFMRAIGTIESIAPSRESDSFVVPTPLEQRQKQRKQEFQLRDLYSSELSKVKHELNRIRIKLVRTLPLTLLVPEPNVPAIDTVLAQLPAYTSPETCTFAEAIAFQIVYLELFDASCSQLDANAQILALRQRFGVEAVPEIVA